MPSKRETPEEKLQRELHENLQLVYGRPLFLTGNSRLDELTLQLARISVTDNKEA